MEQGSVVDRIEAYDVGDDRRILCCWFKMMIMMMMMMKIDRA